mgnify:CR=1 FL=1
MASLMGKLSAPILSIIFLTIYPKITVTSKGILLLELMCPIWESI